MDAYIWNNHSSSSGSLRPSKAHPTRMSRHISFQPKRLLQHVVAPLSYHYPRCYLSNWNLYHIIMTSVTIVLGVWIHIFFNMNLLVSFPQPFNVLISIEIFRFRMADCHITNPLNTKCHLQYSFRLVTFTFISKVLKPSCY